MCKVVFVGFVSCTVFQPSSPSHAEVQFYVGVTHLCKVCKAVPAIPLVPADVCSMQSFKTSERRAGAKQFQAVQHLQDACEPESFCAFWVSFWLGCVSWLVAVSALSASACPPPKPYTCPCWSPWTREGCDKNKSRKRSSQWQLSAPHLITETLLLS